MGVFEFLTIGIVSLSVGSVIKAWIKHRGSTVRLVELESKVRLLESVDQRLNVIEEIVTEVDTDAQFRRLEQREAYKRLPA